MRIVLLLGFIALSCADIFSAETPILWYRQPAQVWTEALPVGNGRLGAMVFGGVAQERLQLNEDTLWTGAPHEYQHEGAAKVLPEMRKLLTDGKQKEAEALAMKDFMSVPLRQEMYQPLGDVLMDFAGHDTATDYRRELNLDSAIATVSYRVGETRFTRETFSSHPDQALIERVSSERPGQVNFSVKLTSPQADVSVQPSGESGLLLTGKVSKGGMTFAVQMRVASEGGRVSLSDGRVVVENANAATVLLTAATGFVNFQVVSADATGGAKKAMQAVAAKDFAALRLAHVTDHQKIFRRMTLDLGTSPTAALPTDERLAVTDKTRDPALATLLFHYGRYLLIASSRPGDQAANLQGIWNDQIAPPWGSKYTTNINAQMNYWPAEVANLSECAEPLFAMIDDLVISGRKTARTHYGARGWVLHHNTDLWRGTAPINNSNHGIWPTGGAWLCLHLWERYLFSGDREFLAKRAYPVMREAALFFVDTLVKDERTGWLISGPSNSPEHGGLVMGPTMDHQIIRGLFAWTAAAAKELGIDGEFASQLETMRGRIAPNQVGKHGQLQEWLEDKDDPADKHRHVSHLWGVFPGDDITWRAPDMMKAARQSLLYRGDGGTGWSLGWKISLWSRFLDGDHAHRILMNQLNFVRDLPGAPKGQGAGGTYPNLFDAHPPFQIDGNFAATAGICEMLVQSHTSEIVLLPALPSAWPTGAVTGLRVRGGYELDLAWREGKLTRVTVRSISGRAVKLRYGERTTEIALAAGKTVEFGGELK